MVELTRDEAVVLVGRIISLDYADDVELNSWLDQLERDLVYPGVSELIFTIDPQLTAAEVVDRALAYQPIKCAATRARPRWQAAPALTAPGR
ncbi:hypothetical protein GCM10023322_00490 [Rugosimonospora acidiphila]|uniref:E9imm peptide n=1 Tax=Rugosimonospora acidiphila TaxID=556531 RepID=A0ABP9RGV7_9ACTN